MHTSIHLSNYFHLHSLTLPIFWLFCSDTMGNMGAFITLKGNDLSPNFKSFEAVVSIFYTTIHCYILIFSTLNHSHIPTSSRWHMQIAWWVCWRSQLLYSFTNVPQIISKRNYSFSSLDFKTLLYIAPLISEQSNNFLLNKNINCNMILVFVANRPSNLLISLFIHLSIY